MKDKERHMMSKNKKSPFERRKKLLLLMTAEEGALWADVRHGMESCAAGSFLWRGRKRNVQGCIMFRKTNILDRYGMVLPK